MRHLYADRLGLRRVLERVVDEIVENLIEMARHDQGVDDWLALTAVAAWKLGVNGALGGLVALILFVSTMFVKARAIAVDAANAYLELRKRVHASVPEVEESIRWESPLLITSRTATVDTDTEYSSIRSQPTIQASNSPSTT